MNELDAVRLNFSPESLVALDFVLAFVHVRRRAGHEVGGLQGHHGGAARHVLIGLFAQFLLLPAVAWLLTMVLRPQPSIALGMILVACCPSGNISNFLADLRARQHRAVGDHRRRSRRWARCSSRRSTRRCGARSTRQPTDPARDRHRSGRDVRDSGDPAGVPTLLGMSVSQRFPGFAAARPQALPHPLAGRVRAFVVGALAANWDYLPAVHRARGAAVFLLNALAPAAGLFGRRRGPPAGKPTGARSRSRSASRTRGSA